MSNQPEMTNAERIHAMAFDKIVNINAELTFRNALLEAEVQVLKEDAMRQQMEKDQTEEEKPKK